MRLSIILENITKREFFDFYALLDAYQDKNHLNHYDIAQHLAFSAHTILADHLEQLGSILVDRLLDPTHAPTKAILDKYGIIVDEDYMYHGIEKLSLKEKAEIIATVLEFNHSHGFTGRTWFGLGKKFLELINTPQSLNSQIAAVDKVYNLTHHNGQITDYMDERNWLEDALNFRDNASPAQIFAQASPNVRALIGRATHARASQQPVPEIAKLYTALRRYVGDKPIEIDISPSRIDVTVYFNELIYDNQIHLGQTWDGKIPERFKDSPEVGKLTLSKPLIGKVSVVDRDDHLIVSGGGTEVPVMKPINRQYNLAGDLVMAAIAVANGRPVNRGSGVSDIKTSYNFIDGKRVKSSLPQPSA